MGSDSDEKTSTPRQIKINMFKKKNKISKSLCCSTNRRCFGKGERGGESLQAGEKLYYKKPPHFRLGDFLVKWGFVAAGYFFFFLQQKDGVCGGFFFLHDARRSRGRSNPAKHLSERLGSERWGEKAGKGEKLGQMQPPLLRTRQKRVKRSG